MMNEYTGQQSKISEEQKTLDEISITQRMYMD